MNKAVLKKLAKDYFFVYILILITFVIWGGNYNYLLFALLNSHHTILPNKYWEMLENIADVRLYIYPFLLIILTVIFRRQKLFNVVILLVSSYIILSLLQSYFNISRPFMILPRGSFFWLGSYGDSDDLGYPGFPSLHIGDLAIFSFALNNLFFKDRFWVEFLVLLRILLISIARVFAGWHWPLDMLGTLLVSYLLVEICMGLKFNKYLNRIFSFYSKQFQGK